MVDLVPTRHVERIALAAWPDADANIVQPKCIVAGNGSTGCTLAHTCLEVARLKVRLVKFPSASCANEAAKERTLQTDQFKASGRYAFWISTALSLTPTTFSSTQ